MKGKLQYEINGVIVVPWPLDENGDPLPVELNLKGISLCN